MALGKKTKSATTAPAPQALVDQLAQKGNDLIDQAKFNRGVADDYRAQALTLTNEASTLDKQADAVVKAVALLDEAGVTL